MRAITVRQSWASLIVQGVKRVENRSRSTSHRGLLAIHAGLTDARGERDPQLVYGAVIGTVEVIDCVRIEDLPAELRDQYATGPWCWVLADPHLIEPIPARGQISLWEWTQ